MKYLCNLIIFLPIMLFARDIDIEKISKQMDRLKSSKKIVSTLDYNVYDPFATAKPILKQKKAKKQKKYHRIIKLQTVLNGRVLIKNKWYSVGDKVYGYKIVKIDQNGISLYKNKKTKKVLFKKRKDFVHITKEIVQ